MKIKKRVIRIIDSARRLIGPGRDTGAKRAVVSYQTPWQWQDIFSSLSPAGLRQILQSVAQNTYLDSYLELAEQIEERDLHYRSVLQQRRLGVAGAPFEVMPGDDSTRARRIADDVKTMTERPIWHDMMLDLLDAQGKGFAGVEVIWERTMSGLQPVAYERIDPRWFVFDQYDGRTLLLRDYGSAHSRGDGGFGQNVHGIPLPDRKVITHLPKTKSGLPSRSGLAFGVVAMSLLKSVAVRDWWAYAEVFGLPLRVGTYPPDATDDDIRTLVSALSNLASDAGAALPESMKIEFPSIAASGQRNQLFESMCRWCDEQVSKAVVGATMTSDDGSSLSQSQVHLSVRDDLIEDDQRQLLNSLNRQIVKWYVDARHGPQAVYPRLAPPIEDTVDIGAIAQAVGIGVQVPQKWLSQRLGIPAPVDGEQVLAGRPNDAMPTTMPPGDDEKEKKKKGMMTLLELNDENSLSPAAAADDWVAIADGLAEPITAALAEAGDADDFLRRALAAGAPPSLADDLALRAFQRRTDGAADEA